MLFRKRIGNLNISRKYITFSIKYTPLLQHRRAIDLALEKRLISEMQLPKDIVPNSYKLDLYPSLYDSTFHGRVLINATVVGLTNEIALHAHTDLQIETSDVTVREIFKDSE